jgi:sugar O-acyltransferase (sialic acid O-acetyltransferase NeuD family)
MQVDVVLIGAGGFGREALDVVEAHNAAHPAEAITVLGVADDAPDAVNVARLSDRGYRHLGTIAEVIAAEVAGYYVLGIGSPPARTSVDARLSAAGWHPVAVIHPAAVIGSMSFIGDGVIICAGVQVSTNVRLGRHVHLNPNATVGHDSVIGNHVSVNPGAIVSGEVTVGAGTLIGAGAVILQQLIVGSGSTIGAGSVVTKSIPDEVVVKGVPGVWG